MKLLLQKYRSLMAFVDKKELAKNLMFFVLLLIISLIYEYPKIALYRPQSVHNWRQSDCTSLALNYYQNGMKFFHPEVHPLISNNLTTNEAATSEIPFLYFFVALLYKIFGYHDYIYRILNTLIFFAGIYSLFRILCKLKSNLVWCLTFSLIFFASPVLVYYGNNFLTDITAFSFSLLAWNFFISYYQKLQKRYYWISMGFFFLAMSMKISAGISVVALFCIYILDAFSILRFNENGKLFPQRFLQLLPFIIIFLVTGAWAYYARTYNMKNGCGYFSTTIYPIWKMSELSLSETIDTIRVMWLNQYFHKVTLLFFAAIFIITLLFIRKANKFLITLQLIIFTGAILYSLLWFDTYKNHDYYLINLYILLVVTSITFIDLTNRIFPKITSNIVLLVILISFLAYNVDHTRKQIHDRYTGWWTEYPKFKDFHTITPYLRSIGITRHDTVISIPDKSHHTLYLMNQPGWTQNFMQNLDSAGIAKSIQRGADYLIVASTEDINSNAFIKPFISDTFGYYNKVRVFKLHK